MPRLHRVVLALALAGLLPHCATSSGAEGSPAPSGDAVGLRFAWPAGFTAQVTSTTVEAQGTQPPERKERRFQLRMEGMGEERKVVTVPVPGEASTSATPAQPMLTPTMVVGDSGEFKRVEGVDQALGEMFKDAESQGVPPEQQKELRGLVGGALEQASRDRWDELVGKWNGLALEPGKPVERKGRMTVPFFGNSLDTVERLTLKERVPCAEGESEKRCVLLTLEASLDPEGTQRGGLELVKRMKAFMKANAGLPESALPEMTVERMQLNGIFELVTEPDTLVPHRLRHQGQSLVVLKSEEEGTQDFRLQGERIEVFTPGAR
ncbi:hypothetical protein [Hyalangium rubrum]|uniref:Lipoprotein n=1 Tax=Hyalangium rubrum TaxID=3103134 RepID=A0ABU5GZS3_9BACT|nr:hypothetical protein [Hyalangium sp. s54d21]MDY7226700.1 hypothetical protein [Hyalangium sp. s54d21]